MLEDLKEVKRWTTKTRGVEEDRDGDKGNKRLKGKKGSGVRSVGRKGQRQDIQYIDHE